MGVGFFMLIIGAGPWIKTCKTDERFVRIMNGDIMGLLKEWNKLNFINKDIVCIFNMIFQFENKRCNLSDIEKCKWLK